MHPGCDNFTDLQAAADTFIDHASMATLSWPMDAPKEWWRAVGRDAHEIYKQYQADIKKIPANLMLDEFSRKLDPYRARWNEVQQAQMALSIEEYFMYLHRPAADDEAMCNISGAPTAPRDEKEELKRRRCDRCNADCDEENSSRENEKRSKQVGDTGSSSRVVVKEEEHQAKGVLGKECARLLAEKGFCIAPFMHDGVSDAVNQLLREGGPADIFFSMDSATALFAAEEEEEEKEEKKKKKGGGACTRRGFWQAGPRRSVMRMVIGEELPGAKALQPNATGGHKAAAARAVAQQMQAAIQRAGEAMRGMAEAVLREIAQELGGEDVMHLVDTYGRGGSTVQAILTVSMISGEVEEGKEIVANCGMHKDRGLLTLVCSREGKGLSVRAHEKSTSTWTNDAEHKNMVTVLGGHVLERVSLGRARAAEHAVFSRGGERLSVALTLRPAEGQSVRVNGAMVAAEDVMGELVGSVNEPKSEEERHSQTEQDPGVDCRGREASDVSEVSEGKVGTEYDTIEITFKNFKRLWGFDLPARTITGVRRTTKLITLRNVLREEGLLGTGVFENGRRISFLDGMCDDSDEAGSLFDFSKRKHVLRIFSPNFRGD